MNTTSFFCKVETRNCENEGKRDIFKHRIVPAEDVFWKLTPFNITLPPTFRKAFSYLQGDPCPSPKTTAAFAKTFSTL